ncbi:MAG: segregation/condensation protein A, partial [Lachnospiraceae bacterium]|nr:segregation/condensation protein A [Lachnospiraceae bacterium]
VKLEVFEGPLDLLLHLIDKDKIDIYDIPIVEITNQYMEYIRSMEKSDLNIMSEFLLMAATLLDIKCKMLLPKEVNEEGEEDPRLELVKQLLQYKMYKYMSYELRDRQVNGEKMLFKVPTVPKEVTAYQEPVDLDKLLDGITLSILNNVFKDVMKKKEDKVDPVRSTFGQIEKEDVPLPEKLDFIEQYATVNKVFSFRQLLETQNTKMHMVVTFLAILELMKVGKLEVVQESTFGDILIKSMI